jgi:hypothetical protein
MRVSSLPAEQVARWLAVSLLVSCVQAVAAQPMQVESGPAGQSQSQNPDVGTPRPGDSTQTPSAGSGNAPSQPSDANGQSGTPQSAPPKAPAASPAPVGTAAAPDEKVIGVPASRPAGAVIAPAKQKRARSILIKVGLIVAAGVAVGTVVALSNASSSKPH